MAFNYHFKTGRYSAERLGLIKIDQILGLLLALLQKLDSDTGVSDTDYESLIASIKTIQEKVGSSPEELREQD